MAKLERIEQEMLKMRERIAEMQIKLKGLDGQRVDAENLQIVQAVRALNMTRDELAAFLSNGKLPTAVPEAAAAGRAMPTKQRYSKRKPDAVTEPTTESEVMPDEA